MPAWQRLPLVLVALCTALLLAAPASASAVPTSAVGQVVVPCREGQACPPLPVGNRYFVQTGYAIDQDAFWNYFIRRGGLPTFGYPVSRTITFLGLPTQFFQRQVMQLWSDGSVHLLNLLDSGLMPYTSFNFSTFPSPDPVLVAQAPSPSDPNYASDAIAFVREHAPNSWNGLPVNFAVGYNQTVTPEAAFPGQPPASAQVQALLPLIQLEIWGLPTSEPAYDPANHGFVYLRWQRGIMMFDTSCTCTQGVLFGDYFKSIITNTGIPVDLASESANSTYFAQYAPSMPNWVARPDELPNTNLTSAFVPEPPILPPVGGSCGTVNFGGAGPALTNGATGISAANCFYNAFVTCSAASLTMVTMGVDTGFTRTFSIASASGQCRVVDVVQPYTVPPRTGLPVTTYVCAGVSKQGAVMVISGCGADGDFAIPLA